jgi:hypothetical protein
MSGASNHGGEISSEIAANVNAGHDLPRCVVELKRGVSLDVGAERNVEDRSKQCSWRDLRFLLPNALA